MPQLPRACHDQHNHLRDDIPHRTGIRALTEVPKVRLALTLVLLLPPDILELLVEVAELRRELRDVRPVVFAIGFGVPDDDVEV